MGFGHHGCDADDVDANVDMPESESEVGRAGGAWPWPPSTIVHILFRVRVGGGCRFDLNI